MLVRVNCPGESETRRTATHYQRLLRQVWEYRASCRGRGSFDRSVAEATSYRVEWLLEFFRFQSAIGDAVLADVETE